MFPVISRSGRSPKVVSPRQVGLDQNMLLETFAKFCAQINDKNNTSYCSQPVVSILLTQLI